MEEQRSYGWYRARLGHITGSCVGKIMGKGRGAEFTKTGLTYLHQIAAERMIPEEVVDTDDYFGEYLDETVSVSKAMRIGTEREEEARDCYRAFNDSLVEETGSVEHPEIRGFASSPDGLVDDDGTLEIKCPGPGVFMEYLAGVTDAESLKKQNADYYWQCMSHMECTGRKWCDFVVYCRYNTRSLVQVRIHRDEEALQTLRDRVRTAEAYIQSLIDKAERGDN